MVHQSPTKATVWVALLSVVGLATGVMAGSTAVARAQDPYSGLEILAKVLSTIQGNYVEEIPTEELVEAAIEGMVNHLDRHTRWLNSEDLATLQTVATGVSTGIGLEVSVKSEGLIVTKVIDGSPAHKKGLKLGDLIVKIDGLVVNTIAPNKITELLKGEQGELATLEVVRESWEEPHTIVTERQPIEQTIVQTTRFNHVLYSRIDSFSAGVAASLKRQLHSNITPATTGLVLDLRDNPGGLLSEAVRTSDLFMTDGVIVSTRRRGQTSNEEFFATKEAFDLPLIVLTNQHSASSAEIVVGALQDTSRATIVGDRTYGKGSVQQVFVHVSDEKRSALKLTVSNYYTPSGKPVARKNGRQPDVFVALPPTKNPKHQLLLSIEEQQLSPELKEQWLVWLDDWKIRETSEQIDWNTPIEERAAKDFVLQKALELLSEESP